MNFAENKRLWIQAAAMGGVIALAAAGYGLWSSRQQAQNDAASDRLYALRELYAQERAQVKIGEYQKADPKSLYPKTIAGLVALDQEQSTAPAAQEARLWLAQLHSRHGQVDVAVSIYARAVEFARGRLEKSAARVAYALALESQGKVDQGLKLLEQAVAESEVTFQAEILFQIARLALHTGQTQRGEQVLRELQTKHAGTPWAQQAEILKNQTTPAQAAKGDQK